MPNIEKEDLLNNHQMADFVNNGFVRLDEVIPTSICTEVKKAMDENNLKTDANFGSLLNDVYSKDCIFNKMVNVSKVRGLIESLVGENPHFDHHCIHKTPAQTLSSQPLHQDNEIDTRKDTFDIQVSFFIHDTPIEMGGTRFLPGSQFRRVHESMIGRYQNIDGMYQVVCKAGTVIAWHHNLWHGAQPNFTDNTRYMFKLRLNPNIRQKLLWNTDGLNQFEASEHISKWQPWFGQEGRIERLNRIRMWRYLTNNPSFDINGWHTRIENEQ
jgi:ectoine hydroxylase-related dioxygenase (phytanoyl-CoA dioxygenase family)